jgi:hypothetical protein
MPKWLKKLAIHIKYGTLLCDLGQVKITKTVILVKKVRRLQHLHGNYWTEDMFYRQLEKKFNQLLRADPDFGWLWEKKFGEMPSGEDYRVFYKAMETLCDLT